MPDTIVGGDNAAILTRLYDLRDLGLLDADEAARIEAALANGNSAVIARASTTSKRPRPMPPSWASTPT
jgi:hypothetical protein